MTSKNKNVLTMALSKSKENLDPGYTVAATHPVFDFLTTFNDLQNENVSTRVKTFSFLEDI